MNLVSRKGAVAVAIALYSLTPTKTAIFGATAPSFTVRLPHEVNSVFQYPLDAPAGVERGQYAAKEFADEGRRQVVVDPDSEARSWTLRQALKSHFILTDNKQSRRASCAPDLAQRRLTKRDDLVYEEGYSERGATHADVGADASAPTRVELVRHAAAAHHRGRPAHMLCKSLLIIEMVK